MPHEPRIITLGTAGGPRWWARPQGASERAGISTAVCVNDAVYLVDCGRGSATRFAQAGLSADQLRGVFVTHLHSDHTVDLAELLLFSWMCRSATNSRKVTILGPGDRGMVPPLKEGAAPVTPIFGDSSTSGTAEMVEHTLRANSTDITDRMFDNRKASPWQTFEARDIEVPEACGFHPNENACPDGMEPFEIFRDENVVVTAILVDHFPMAPAFAFRFDAEGGSVTISGDTARCENMIRLARGTDLLLHEAIDLEFDLSWLFSVYSTASSEVRENTIAHHRNSHTTALEAGEVAEAAGAKALALHHLVPGHTDAAAWAPAGTSFSGELFIPEDLTVIPFGR